MNSWHYFINYYKIGQKYIKLNYMWWISVTISQPESLRLEFNVTLCFSWSRVFKLHIFLYSSRIWGLEFYIHWYSASSQGMEFSIIRCPSRYWDLQFHIFFVFIQKLLIMMDLNCLTYNLWFKYTEIGSVEANFTA